MSESTKERTLRKSYALANGNRLTVTLFEAPTEAGFEPMPQLSLRAWIIKQIKDSGGQIQRAVLTKKAHGQRKLKAKQTLAAMMDLYNEGIIQYEANPRSLGGMRYFLVKKDDE